MGMCHTFGKYLRTGIYELGLLPQSEMGSIAQVKGTNIWGMGNKEEGLGLCQLPCWEHTGMSSRTGILHGVTESSAGDARLGT